MYRCTNTTPCMPGGLFPQYGSWQEQQLLHPVPRQPYLLFCRKMCVTYQATALMIPFNYAQHSVSYQLMGLIRLCSSVMPQAGRIIIPTAYVAGGHTFIVPHTRLLVVVRWLLLTSISPPIIPTGPEASQSPSNHKRGTSILWVTRTGSICVCPSCDGTGCTPYGKRLETVTRVLLGPWTAEHLDHALTTATQHKRFTINDINLTALCW